MKYAGIIKNDFSAAPGICLTFFTQGCPHKCHNCQNPETWDFKGGKEFTYDTLSSIIEGLKANGIERKLCIMGGEPLCPENLFLTNLVIQSVRQVLPNVKVYLWTGYLYKDIKNSKDTIMQNILQSIDVLIDGPFIESERDITEPMKGSRNQRIIYFDR